MLTLWQDLAGRLPFEWAQFTFMQNALLALLLLCPLFALLGCMVINNQMSFYSEAIGHSALTGIAIGVLVGLAKPLWAMLLWAVLLAVLVTALRRWSAAPPDTVIGLLMAFTVALGVVLLSRGGGFNKYSQFLIGDILTISPGEIGGILLLLGVVLVLWVLVFNRLLLVSVNRSLARSRGLSVWYYETLLAVIVAVVVSVSIPWVGVLVINSMLILPAAAARNLARSTRSYVWGAVACSLAAGTAGFVLSYYWRTATGATVVLMAMGVFLVTLGWRLLLRR